MGGCLGCLGESKPPDLDIFPQLSFLEAVDHWLKLLGNRAGNRVQGHVNIVSSYYVDNIGVGDIGTAEEFDKYYNNVEELVWVTPVPVPRVENLGTQQVPIVLNAISGRSRKDLNGILESLVRIIDED